MSYSYALNIKAHLCKRLAAIAGITLLLPRTDIKGLWSINKVNLRPNEYSRNFVRLLMPPYLTD